MINFVEDTCTNYQHRTFINAEIIKILKTKNGLKKDFYGKFKKDNTST